MLSVPITDDTDGERHGLMLVVHMLRRYQSVHFIHRLMVTHYSDLCRDYTFLHPIHVKLQQQVEVVYSSIYSYSGIAINWSEYIK